MSADPVAFESIEALWRTRRDGVSCQIVRDSILPRGLADAFALRVDASLVGFAGVWREHFPGRVMDFWLESHATTWDQLFAALVDASGAHEVEAQSNMEEMWALLESHGYGEPVIEHHLFEDGVESQLHSAPGLTAVKDLSLAARADRADGPDAEWLLVIHDEVVAWGGVLGHYNPPFVDLFMEVAPEWRRRGLGAHLVYELRRIGRRDGGRPAARCAPDNAASSATLLRGGMRHCGTLAVRSLVAPP